MRTTLLCVICATVLYLGSLSAKEYAQAGIITALGAQFFDDYQTIFLDKFIQIVETSDLPTTSNVFRIDQLGMDVNFTVTKFVLKNASLDEDGTMFKMQQDKPSLTAQLKDISFEFDFYYNLTTDPELLQDIGVGNIIIDKLSVSASGSPKKVHNEEKEKNDYEIEMNDIAFSVKNFTCGIDGGDLATLVNSFSDILAAYIKDFLLIKFNKSMISALEESINQYIVKIDTNKKFDDYNLVIDYSLVDEGVHVSDKFISITFDGSVHTIGQALPPQQRAYSTLPYFKPDGKDFQIFISQYTMESILVSVVENQWLTYNSSMDSDKVSIIIPDFEDTFGEQDQVKVQLHTNKNYPPSISIDETKCEFKIECDAHFKNPFDDSIDSMIMRLELTAQVSFDVDEDFTLVGSADDVDLKVVEIEPYFRTRTNKDNINDRIGMLKIFAIGLINSQLMKGMSIPIPQNITKYIKNPTVQTFSNYIFIDTEPDFSSIKQDKKLKVFGSQFWPSEVEAPTPSGEAAKVPEVPFISNILCDLLDNCNEQKDTAFSSSHSLSDSSLEMIN